MSHFAVTVCLPTDTTHENVERVLEDVMSQWDENRDVEPYRDYEDGSAEDYWWVNAVRRGAQHHRNGTGIKPYSPDAFAGSEFSKYTEAQQLAELADDADWAEKLGDHPTWADVVTHYNAKYGEEERLQYDEETGRAFTWSQRNPDSLWDYWRIGGRWSGHFVAREVTPEVLLPDSHWDGPKGLGRGFVDGGPKRLLDFEAMREKAASEANARYDQWDKLCAKTPHAKEWAHFVGLHKAGELTIEQARERYHAQPRIAAARSDQEMGWYDDIVEHFGMSRDEYVANARRDAIAGYALVTLDRRWMAPGRMGWFGMSTDEPGTVDAYKTEANAYLEGLDPDVLIVQLDCHI